MLDSFLCVRSARLFGRTWIAVVLSILATTLASQTGWSQFVAFNDFAPGGGTASNATTFGPPSQVGSLKDISSGATLGVTLTVFSSGIVLSTNAGSPAFGTPAFIIFDGFVDFNGEPNPSVELNDTASVTYYFSGLDPASEYNLQASAIRGEPTYTDRWSLFQLNGSRGFTNRHSSGTLTSSNVATITAAQVAINTGDNAAGNVAWWEHIRPSIDGTFSVLSRKYNGPVPGGSSGGAVGYGITGFRLEQGGIYSGRTSAPSHGTNTAPNAINGINNVFLIVMENHNWSSIKDSSFCPYINHELLPNASYANQYFTPAGLHPSEPNYIWLIAGDNFGIRNDNPPSNNHLASTNNLFTLLDHAGIPWKSYQENISGTDCPDANNYPYAVRHNPFVFFDSVRNDSSYCGSHIRPFTELASDLANNNVRRFNFITPNLTNDMHDGTRQQGDDWLAANVPAILNSAAYNNGGLLIITWDEGSNDSDGPIGLIALSPRAKGHGYNNHIRYTHSSTLRTFQDIFGVYPYLGDASTAESLRDLFNAPAIVATLWQTNFFQLTVTNLISTKTNILQASPDLTPGSWVNIQTNVAVSTGETLKDFFPIPPTARQRFYQVIELQ